MKRTLSPLLLALLLLLLMPWGGAVWAEQPVAGQVLAVSGTVTVEREGSPRPLVSRDPLFSGDVVVTGDGRIQIRFSDGSLLSLYEQTRFSIDEYRYGSGTEDRADYSLVDGVMHTLTGAMPKANYRLKTRLAVLGVRGTDYSARLGSDLHVSVNSGAVLLSNSAGSLLVNAGSSALVTRGDAVPSPTPRRLNIGGKGAAARPAAAPPPPAVAPGGVPGVANGGAVAGAGAPPPAPSGQSITHQLPPPPAPAPPPPVPPPQPPTTP